MAARKIKIRHDEETRAKIQAGNLITRLQAGINGEVELSGPQVTAALGLLRKVLPDLTSVEHSGEITTTYVARAPQVAPSEDAWQDQHVPTLQ